MPPRKKPPTALERQRKINQYVCKKKGKATPSHDPTLGASLSHGSTPKGTPTQDVTPVASPYTPGYSPSQTQTELQTEEVVSAAPVYNAGEGSSSRAAPQEDDGGPVDKSVLTTFNDHVAYAIWHRTLQAGIVAALALLEGVVFGGQTHDSSDAVNEAYDILKAASLDNEEEDRRPESRTKSRHDPTATAPAPATTIPAPSRAKPPPKKRPKK
ncbi:hypothetical protein LguiB_005632 [Lonicera macranthoides]